MIRIRYTGDLENSPPVPVIKLKDGEYRYEVGETLAFDGSESSDPDGDALLFAWDFGDGTLSQEMEPKHSFQETGEYQVELVVTDTAGVSQRTSMKISKCIKMLELGLCPIRYLIKKKRILYFHKLIKSDEKNIAKRVFEKQWETPLKGDFAAYLKQDLNEIGIAPNTVFSFKEYSKDQFENKQGSFELSLKRKK